MPASISVTSKKRAAHQIAERLHKETNLTNHECELLVNFMQANCKNHSGRLDKMRFRDILIEHFEFTDSILMDQVFKTFDLDSDGFVTVEEWVKGMSVFLRGSSTEQAQFCFKTYDMKLENFLTRDVMFTLLKNCLADRGAQELGEDDPEEGVKDLIETVLKKMDLDKDTKVGFDDYKTSCDHERLLLEFLGEVLPEKRQVACFFRYLEKCDKNQSFYI
ncbi:calaxin-like [Convolutriloba macropyga]|uniref:calaxin-like n=1 Tax=Convolutriloba macropyga TaxID=536237 RepID=UPI003F522C96